MKIILLANTDWYLYNFRLSLAETIKSNGDQLTLLSPQGTYVQKLKKMGFAMPIDKWLRTELRDWAESLLADSRLDRDGFFVKEEIRQKWQEHVTGQRNWQYLIWPILMFQAWLDSNKSS